MLYKNLHLPTHRYVGLLSPTWSVLPSDGSCSKTKVAPTRARSRRSETITRFGYFSPSSVIDDDQHYEDFASVGQYYTTSLHLRVLAVHADMTRSLQVVGAPVS